MKIAFFTEGPSGIKYPRNFANMRTDIAWMVSMKTDNYNHYSILPHDDYDLGIIIVPKKNPRQAFDCFTNNRKKCTKWAVMQEGPHELWQDWDVVDQFSYLYFLQDVDYVLCHNEVDLKYYRGIVQDPSKVHIMQSLMIEDVVPRDIVKPENRSGIMIGGNWTSWYSGQDSMLVASHIKEEKLYAPSMGRKPKDEIKVSNLTHIPYVNWADWIYELSKVKYGIHLMRTYAAGTFALNCAYLGIPCIGYESLDTQRICFPELSVKEGDLEKAGQIAKHLRENTLFYNHISEYAKKIWQDKYSEKAFLINMNKIFKTVFEKSE